MQTRVKMVVVGPGECGKSSIINRLRHQSFIFNNETTVGAEFHRINNCEIWDTSGQTRFFEITGLYLREAQVVAFVFDVQNKDYEKQKEYLQKIYKKVKSSCGENFTSFLIATKVDGPLLEEINQQLKDLAKELNVKDENVFKCSAKYNTITHTWNNTPQQGFICILNRAIAVTPQKPAEIKISTPPLFTPEDLHKKYDSIWEQNKNARCTFFSRAKDIFINYASNTFFHLGRNHVDQITAILTDQKNPVTTTDDLLARVEKIQLKNPSGSLARRRAFVNLKKAEYEKIRSTEMGIKHQKPSK